MQCLWFLLEEGESWKRQGNTGMALKRLHQIDKVSSAGKSCLYVVELWFHRSSPTIETTSTISIRGV